MTLVLRYLVPIIVVVSALLAAFSTMAFIQSQIHNTYGTYQGDNLAKLDNGTMAHFNNLTHCGYKLGDRLGLIILDNGTLVGGLECLIH